MVRRRRRGITCVAQEARVCLEHLGESRAERARQLGFSGHHSPELLPRGTGALRENPLAHPALEAEELYAFPERSELRNSIPEEVYGFGIFC